MEFLDCLFLTTTSKILKRTKYRFTVAKSSPGFSTKYLFASHSKWGYPNSDLWFSSLPHQLPTLTLFKHLLLLCHLMVHKCDPFKPTHCSIKWLHINSYPVLYAFICPYLLPGILLTDDFKTCEICIILYVVSQVPLLHLLIGLQSAISFSFSLPRVLYKPVNI